MRMMIALCCLFFLSFHAQAADDLESRTHDLARQLRCLVCQGQSIDESDAPLAHDLNTIIREKVAAGWSDQQILDYMTERYGDFILLKPPFALRTLILWMGPFLILSAGFWVIVSYWRKRG